MGSESYVSFLYDKLNIPYFKNLILSPLNGQIPKSNSEDWFQNGRQLNLSLAKAENTVTVEQSLMAKGLALLLSTAISAGISYFVLKLLMKLLDPTHKDKAEAQKKVSM